MKRLNWPIRRKSYSPVGLDIGRGGIRAAQIEWRRDNGIQGARVRTALLPWAGGRAGAAPLELPESDPAWTELARRLRRMLHQQEFRGRAAVAGLSSPDVELHALELPAVNQSAAHLERDGLRQAARFELERLMSFEDQEVESDYWPLPRAKSGSTTALGVAARKCYIQSLNRLCSEASLDCRRVDAGACALARFAVTTGEVAGAAAAGVSGVLDLGCRQSRLVLCLEQVPVVVRTFDTSCEKWIRLLADALKITPEAAEIHLRDHGILPSARGIRAGAESALDAAPSAQLGGILHNVLRGELEILCREIERSFRYVLECYPDRRGGELILAGGGSEIRRIADFFSDKLGIPVCTAAQRWSAAAWTIPYASSHQSVGALTCAVGLAIEPGAAA